MEPVRKISRKLLGALMICAALGCGDEGEADGDAVAFRFQLESDTTQTFTAWTSRQNVISEARSELARPRAERSLHPNGILRRGNGGRNDPWSWHLDPEQWNLVELSIELCDGTPQFVEEDLDYWVDTVGTYCPWGARVEAEVE